MKPFIVVNHCHEYSEPILVTVKFYGREFDRTGSVAADGGCDCLSDDRPDSDFNTEVLAVTVGTECLTKIGRNDFEPKSLKFEHSGKTYDVNVIPIYKANADNKDKTIIGIEMQDGAKVEDKKKPNNPEAIFGKHFAVLNNTSCPKDPLSVVVVYEGNYPVPGSAPRGKLGDVPDNRPSSGPSTDIVDIWEEGQRVRQINGVFVQTTIGVNYFDQNYSVIVIPHHAWIKHQEDRAILGIEMQDGNLIEGEKKAKKKVKKTAKKKQKKSGSKPVKAKKAGKKTKSKK